MKSVNDLRLQIAVLTRDLRGKEGLELLSPQMREAENLVLELIAKLIPLGEQEASDAKRFQAEADEACGYDVDDHNKYNGCDEPTA